MTSPGVGVVAIPPSVPLSGVMRSGAAMAVERSLGAEAGAGAAIEGDSTQIGEFLILQGKVQKELKEFNRLRLLNLRCCTQLTDEALRAVGYKLSDSVYRFLFTDNPQLLMLHDADLFRPGIPLAQRAPAAQAKRAKPPKPALSSPQLRRKQKKPPAAAKKPARAQGYLSPQGKSVGLDTLSKPKHTRLKAAATAASVVERSQALLSKRTLPL